MDVADLLRLGTATAFVRDLPIGQYHAHPAESSTLLKKLLLSPAHYRLARLSPPPQTDAMRFGSAAHCLILEPHLFDREYLVLPKGEKTTDAELAGRERLTPEEMATLEHMREAVMSHPTARLMLANGVAEQSAFWTDAGTGIACRCRPDWLNPDYGIIDLKTARDATAAGFATACANLRYDLSASFYIDGVHAATGDAWPFILLAVEKAPPYTVGVYRVSARMEARGRARYQEALAILKRCREVDQWPSWRGDGCIEEINLPAWDR